MTVQDAVRTSPDPGRAEPSDPPVDAVAPPTAVPPAVAPLLGRDRPRTEDERLFLIGLAVLTVALGAIIVSGLLMAHLVWA